LHPALAIGRNQLNDPFQIRTGKTFLCKDLSDFFAFAFRF
jgi:hypothetical protein